MAIIYVRSTTGLDTNSGATWALAKATVAGATAIALAGDTIYVSQVHNETGNGVTAMIAGTIASPVNILGVSDAAEPPVAAANTSIITWVNGTGIFRGPAFIQGINFKGGSSGAIGSIAFDDPTDLYNRISSCTIDLSASTVASTIGFGAGNATSPGLVEFENVNIKFGASSQAIKLFGAMLHYRGGSVLAGSVALTTFIVFGGFDRGPGKAFFENLDLSNLGVAVNLVKGNADTPGVVIFRNCKMPIGWTGSLVSPAITRAGFSVQMYNSDSADTNNRIWTEDFMGSAKSETTIVRTGTTLSWKVTASALAKYPSNLLESPEIVIRNETVGTPVTVTIDVVHDSQGGGTLGRFKDDELWIEVDYLGDLATPLGSHIDDAKADIFAAGADQADSTMVWTTTGLTTPLKQKLNVTFTPQKIGVIHAKVVLAKAGSTCYVSQDMTVA